jgi:hypothetical protein
MCRALRQIFKGTYKEFFFFFFKKIATPYMAIAYYKTPPPLLSLPSLHGNPTMKESYVFAPN